MDFEWMLLNNLLEWDEVQLKKKKISIKCYKSLCKFQTHKVSCLSYDIV